MGWRSLESAPLEITVRETFGASLDGARRCAVRRSWRASHEPMRFASLRSHRLGSRIGRIAAHRLAADAALIAAAALPRLAAAQSSPFLTGATALQSNILAWLTPIAVILVMVLGAMAMANRMSWGWCIGAILGIAIAFGAPQIVTWVRGLFGV